MDYENIYGVIILIIMCGFMITVICQIIIHNLEDRSDHHWGQQGSEDRNWKDDFKWENGNYICHCYKCKNEFIGHKRRIICKTCSDKFE